MYPNNQDNPFNQQPTGIDYLNQISTPAPSAGFDKKTKIILAILGLVGILSLGLIFAMSQNSQSTVSPSKIAARVQKLLTVSQKYNNKLQSSKLQTVNSSLVSVLTTANSSIAEPLKNNDIDLKKQQKEIAKLDPSTDLEKKLDEAVLNAQIDTIYAHEINVQLTDTINMMKRLHKSTSSKSMKSYLEKTVDDLQNIQKQITEIIKN